MPRKSLRPNLNQIRAWVRQGRTDAWVAHQLEVSVRDIEQFKRQNDLVEEDASETTPASDYPDEIDLRAEDDALTAAELEAAEVEAGRAKAEAAEKAAQEPDADEDADDGEETAKPRARRRRGGRGRRGVGSRPAGVADVDVACSARARPALPQARSRAPSITARRVTACGSTPRSRTTRSTPSIGPAPARWGSQSRRTAS